MVEVVNVVGSGLLSKEFDLVQVAEDLGSKAKYDPEKYPGLYLHLDEDSPLITLYRTGKFITTGADSEEEAFKIRDRFLQTLHDMGAIDTAEDEWFQIQNYVCTADMKSELNLNALAIGLGLENTEYEPEQFPGLIYRPAEAENVVLIFASGKVVITGSPDLETAKSTFESLANKTAELLN